MRSCICKKSLFHEKLLHDLKLARKFQFFRLNLGCMIKITLVWQKFVAQKKLLEKLYKECYYKQKKHLIVR